MPTSENPVTETDPTAAVAAEAAGRRRQYSRERALPPPGWLATSVNAFAALVGVSTNFLYQQIAAGQLRARRVGRRTIITRTDAETWLAGLEMGVGASPTSIRQWREGRQRAAVPDAGARP